MVIEWFEFGLTSNLRKWATTLSSWMIFLPFLSLYIDASCTVVSIRLYSTCASYLTMPDWQTRHVNILSGYACSVNRPETLPDMTVRWEPISKSCEITQADNLNRRRRLSRKAQCFK